MKQVFRLRTLLLLLCVLYVGNIIYTNAYTKPSIPILGFHHIVPDEDKKAYYANNMWVASLSSFEEQMRLLHELGYQTLTLEEFQEWKEGKREVSKKSVVLTFDDGFYSTTKFAQPILKKYGFRGSVFVIGSAIDNAHGPYKPDKRQHASQKDMEDQRVLQYYSHSYNLHHKGKQGFKVNTQTYQQLQKDTEKAKQCTSIAYYAYPYGKYNSRIQEVLRKEGVRLAFGFNENRKATRGDDPYGIPRFCVNAYTKLDVFRAMLESR